LSEIGRMPPNPDMHDLLLLLFDWFEHMDRPPGAKLLANLHFHG